MLVSTMSFWKGCQNEIIMLVKGKKVSQIKTFSDCTGPTAVGSIVKRLVGIYCIGQDYMVNDH